MISVVVPVYKVEKYIGQCIESVVGQTYENWELLLAADETADRSIDICREYAQKDARIRVIPHSNTGVSGARNAGIVHAAGNYIMFMDGDDYLESDTLASMRQTLEQSQADACYCRRFFKNDEQLHAAVPAECSGVMAAEDAVVRHLHGGFISSACFALTKLSKVKDVLFCEQIHTMEDWEYNFRQLTCLDRVVILDKAFYHYRVVAGSASRSSLDDRKLSCLLIPEAVKSYIEENGLPYEKEATGLPAFLINQLLVVMANRQYERKPAKKLRSYARKHLVSTLRAKHIRKRQKVYMLMAAVSPKIYCWAYKIKN